MTNVPQTIREMWTDLYKLFDAYYLMPNTANSWKSFWNQAQGICHKNGENEQLREGIWIVSDIIGKRMIQERKKAVQ